MTYMFFMNQMGHARIPLMFSLQHIRVLHMMHDYTYILHIILVYHSPPMMTHRSHLQQFSPFNYLSLSPIYDTYPHIPKYYMYFNLLHVASGLSCIYTPYRILDYYPPHVVVHKLI